MNRLLTCWSFLMNTTSFISALTPAIPLVFRVMKPYKANLSFTCTQSLCSMSAPSAQPNHPWYGKRNKSHSGNIQTRWIHPGSNPFGHSLLQQWVPLHFHGRFHSSIRLNRPDATVVVAFFTRLFSWKLTSGFLLARKSPWEKMASSMYWRYLANSSPMSIVVRRTAFLGLFSGNLISSSFFPVGTQFP